MELSKHPDKKYVAIANFVNIDERRRFAYRAPYFSLAHQRFINLSPLHVLPDGEQSTNVTYRTLGHVAGTIIAEAGIRPYNPAHAILSLAMLEDISNFLDSQRDLGLPKPAPETTPLE